MRKVLTVKKLYQGFVMDDGKREFGQDVTDIKATIGAAVLNFLFQSCGGDTCTVTIEGPDKKEETRQLNPYQFDDRSRVTIGELPASARPLGNKVNHILGWIMEHEKEDKP